MRVAPVHLASGAGGRREARWRPLTGADELALYGCDYGAAIEWMAGALTEADGTLRPADLTDLTLADGDRLFQALYRAFFGDRAELRQACGGCGKPFELSIVLDALLGEAPPAEEESLPGGTRLRAVRIADLVAGGPLALLDRVTLEKGDDPPAALEAALERLSPAAIDTVETACPACRAQQHFAFDLSRFFLRCCERERPMLLREIDLLARTYCWALSEILALERAHRHDLVRLAAAASVPARRRVAAA
ncbi:MAG: hypothetical protein JOZ90_04155 [Alphaproteobacteria bacterium]|nr:hypothetical protein [Alphaproteobacteria bacterium]MBV9373185.1 hypothetical protein [Alphaproteobacteria bacterium]MBV9900274.1 hypothetical protein [Alphaproteobacteria bacterium]